MRPLVFFEKLFSVLIQKCARLESISSLEVKNSTNVCITEKAIRPEEVLQKSTLKYLLDLLRVTKATELLKNFDKAVKPQHIPFFLKHDTL